MALKLRILPLREPSTGKHLSGRHSARTLTGAAVTWLVPERG